MHIKQLYLHFRNVILTRIYLNSHDQQTNTIFPKFVNNEINLSLSKSLIIPVTFLLLKTLDGIKIAFRNDQERKVFNNSRL